MNRVIKFRAWDFGHKCFLPDDCYAVLNRTEFGAFAIMTKDWDNYCEGEFFYDNQQELQQFTGLHDKNGKEIYEGDIIQWTSKNPFSLGDVRTVQVNYVQAQFWCRGRKLGVYLAELLFNEDCEVIGNIHENPELITNNK